MCNPDSTLTLSVIVVAYNMGREIPRTLQSLTRNYQLGCTGIEHEVHIMDNGSTGPLQASVIENMGPEFHYHHIDNAPASPAHALNHGVEQSRGELICIMVDGAHILTPGVFNLALRAHCAFDNPVVLTRHFFLGPGSQNETIFNGYTQSEEDRLLGSINWPEDGYALFSIGTPHPSLEPRTSWFSKMTESNCLFMKRSSWEAMGGADERFDLPGGGFLNADLYHQSARLEGATTVQLIGEGSFHQLHGGATTNIRAADRDAKVHLYHEQYKRIRGMSPSLPEKSIYYLGHTQYGDL